MKLLIAMLLFVAMPAQADMTYYLVAQWFDGPNQFCRYSNGTVLNIGVGTCPMSIRGP